MGPEETTTLKWKHTEGLLNDYVGKIEYWAMLAIAKGDLQRQT